MTNKEKKIYNVFGLIEGSREPDRYVLMGNHRDAWTKGAIDPVSGTATMMEVSRVMAEFVRKGHPLGALSDKIALIDFPHRDKIELIEFPVASSKTGLWRPKRTIIFCSWGAEEYGLIGSTEFVEEYLKTLKERSVAYINVDMAVTGQYMVRVVGTPLFQNVVDTAMKRVANPNPTERFMNLFEQNLHRDPFSNGTIGLRSPGTGSDYAPFVFEAGIPSVDYSFISDKNKGIAFPTYHTKYDTFEQIKTFVDPTFKYHRAVSQLWIETARLLTDSLFIPFSVFDYASLLQKLVQSMDVVYGKPLSYLGIKLTLLKQAVDDLVKAARIFDRKKTLPEHQNSPYSIRSLNDQLMQFERAFLRRADINTQRGNRHVIFSPMPSNSYYGSGFSRIIGAIDKLVFETSNERKDAFLKELYVTVFSIRSAISVLSDPIDFIQNRDAGDVS